VKKYITSSSILLVTLLVILGASCKKKDATDEYADVQGSYFSINQFILDQWNTFSGEPISIIKTVKVNKGKTDSSFTNSDTLSWAPIFKTFAETDISDRKFLGKYNFTQFDDNQDQTHNFFYQAKDEDLLTQKLLITIDQYNNKVKGIYIETYKKDFGDECTQKLYYAPLKTLQIQTDDKPWLGSKKFTVVQYEFMR
jgi:hypothetical protein